MMMEQQGSLGSNTITNRRLSWRAHVRVYWNPADRVAFSAGENCETNKPSTCTFAASAMVMRYRRARRLGAVADAAPGRRSRRRPRLRPSAAPAPTARWRRPNRHAAGAQPVGRLWCRGGGARR